jgi:hypothetical protein
MRDPRSFYTGWLLHPADRERLLKRFPPRYPVVVAHHVTLKFGERAAGVPIEAPVEPLAETVGEIVGEAEDGLGVQALVVRIGGTTARPDGSTYHITWSLAEGREARESNAVIARRGWTTLAEPVAVRLQPKPSDPG